MTDHREPRPVRIAYCGCDLFAGCLRLLLDSGRAEVLHIFCEIKGCEEVQALALERRIPISFRPISERDMEELFDRRGCDYVVSACYRWKIPIGDRRGVNLHPTLLPMGRGPWPFPHIILEGHRDSGVTLHRLTDRFDAGDILLQQSFPLDPGETHQTLVLKSVITAPELLREWLEDPETLWQNARPQGEGVYLKRLPQESARINVHDTPEEARLKIRAFGYGDIIVPGTGERYASAQAFCQRDDRAPAEGTVLCKSRRDLAIAIRGGVLYIANAQVRRRRSLGARITGRLKRLFGAR
ncbi:MAG: hypothetical protein IK083_06025 [Abditibacteriota bacterium]|nr:hypothetical protein [Abditibacteriota bacterium]